MINSKRIKSKIAENLKRIKSEITKFNVFSTCLFVLLGALSLPVIDKLNLEIFVKNYFNYIETSVPNDVIMLLLLLCAIAFIIVSFGKKTLSIKYVLISVLFVIYYSLHRTLFNVFDFTPSYFLPKLYYADIIYVALFASLSLLYKKGIEKPPKTTGIQLVEDVPIEKGEKDAFGYKTYAKQIADRINNSTVAQSFAIGINGKWGVGKTSFLKLIRNNLKEENLIQIDFNPWSVSSTDNLHREFFNLVLSELENVKYDLYKILKRYANKYLSSNGNSSLEKILNRVNFFDENNTISKLYKDVNRILKETNNKLIICIDDLDRLQADEVKEVLRLIRITANFYNTFFIVAYDRDYLINATQQFSEFHSKKFVEKIFQLEISLPYSRKEVLTRTLCSNLKKIFPSENHTEIQQGIIGGIYIFRSYLHKWIENMRDVSRLTNSLGLNLDKIINDVVFKDFLQVELLRIKYPSVYKTLSKEPKQFLILEDKNFNFWKSSYGLKIKDKGEKYVMSQNNRRDTEVFQYLTDNSKYYNLDERDIDKIVKLLSFLFRKRDESRADTKSHLSVVYPSKYRRYFSYRLEDELSEVDFSKGREGSLSEFKDIIQNWVDDGLESEVRQRLGEVKAFDNLHDFENVIEAMFYLAHLPRSDDFQGVSGIDGGDLKDKLGFFRRNYQTKTGYITDVKPILDSFFKKETGTFQIEASIINSWRSDAFDANGFTNDEMDKLLLDYLKNYTSLISKLNSNVWHLLYSCKITTHHEEFSSGRPVKGYISGAREVFKKFVAQNDIDQFLYDVIELMPRPHFFDNPKFCLIQNLPEIFSSWEGFYDWVHKLEANDSKYLVEFKHFLERFKEKKYEVYINFEFKDIPVSKKMS